jgi:hypothetical protein
MFRWENNLSEQERIAKNVTNLMNIKKNEVAFDRNLGQSSNFIDKSVNRVTSEMITDLYDMISEKEPRAEITIDELLLSVNGNIEYKVVVRNA